MGDVVHCGRRNLQRTAPKHALTILQRCLGPLLAGIHARRLAGRLEAVAATVCGPRLTLTDIGRRFGGEASLRNKTKRSDRLLGKGHVQGQERTLYGALAAVLLRRLAEPLLVIDWSDLKADQLLHLLRASLPVGGRSLTLYEEVHPQGKLGNRQVQRRFLQRLAQMLPASAEPIIVADSGFKVPFFREVERLGWRWLGRVRDYIKLKQRWRSCKRLFEEATTTASCLGSGQWVRSNPLHALFVRVLIASLAAILLRLIGTAAERTGLHERLRPCSGKRRAYSRLCVARLLLTVEHCKAAAVDLAHAIGPLDQWVASDHAALLAG